ncbi:MAG: DUF4105 domain-containing protein [Candidatus Pacebacteria bacterium]|jgi:hypothetical protein|nr:DUF4105 domain-containing protein [Candidatus Paceibacterota bacterium]
MNKNQKKICFIFIFTIVLILIFWQITKKPLPNNDWPETYATLAETEINENIAHIKNVRNFRYNSDETVDLVDYYDKSYDLNKLKKVWFIFEPFSIAAHTFLSFEFENDVFLTVSIEARTNKKQKYNAYVGLFRSYHLIYVISDERDSFFVRTNIRNNQVNLYPMNLSQEQGKKLLLNLLEEANELRNNPKWYNTLTANCTNLLFSHLNCVLEEPIHYSWKMLFTGFSDELIFDKNLISLKKEKNKYDITKKSREIGNVESYSLLIREGIND